MRPLTCLLIASVLSLPVLAESQVSIVPESLTAGDIPGNSTWSAPISITNQGEQTTAWSLSVATERGVSQPILLRSGAADVRDISTLWTLTRGTILNHSRLKSHLLAGGATYTTWTAGPLTPELLAEHDVLVVPVTTDLQGGLPWPTADVEVLSEWVLNGGGLALVGNGSVRVPAFNTILQSLGVGIEVIPESAQWGWTDRWIDHAMTVDAVPAYVSPDAHLRTTQDAFPILAALDGQVIGAVSQAGAGRVAVVTSDILARGRSTADFQIGLQMVSWLGGASWVTADPAEDWSIPGIPTVATVNVDARGLVAGDYAADLFFGFSDSTLANIPVPLDFRVTGGPEIHLPSDVVDFGSVVVGYEDSREFLVVNFGADTLHVTHATPPGSPGVLLSGLPVAVPPQLAILLTVSLTTDSPGDFQAQVVLHHDSGTGTSTLTVSGTAVLPASFESDLADVSTSLFNGTATQRTFHVSNAGSGPLHWEATASPDASQPQQDLTSLRIGRPNTPHWFSLQRWTQDASSRGATFIELDAPLSEDSRAGLDLIWMGSAPPLQDVGPLADWVRAGGCLILEGRGTDFQPILSALDPEIEYVVESDPTAEPSGATFEHELTSGNLQFYLGSTNTHLTLGSSPATVLFHNARGEPVAAAEPVGDGRLLVLARAMLGDTFIGFLDNRVLGNRALRWATRGSWLAVSPARGTIPPGDSVELTLTMDATGLDQPNYNGAVNVSHNDRSVAARVAAISLVVTPAPDSEIQPLALDFGDTMVGSQGELSLMIANHGTAALSVAGIISSGPEFSASVSSLEVPPGEVDSVTVRFLPSVLGPMSGSLSWTSNDPTLPSQTIPLSGNGIAVPQIEVRPTSFPVALQTGLHTSAPMTISNPGETPLEWSLDIDAPQPGAQLPWVFPAREVALQEEGRVIPVPELTAELQDLTGIRILFDETHGSPLEWFEIMADDLRTRGAHLFGATGPITPELLSTYDVLWLYVRTTWTAEEAQVVGDWVRDGGAVVVEGLNVNSQNVVLAAMDAGVQLKRFGVTTRETGTIFPHPTTENIEHLRWKFSFLEWLEIEDPSVQVLFTDVVDRPMGAVTSRGRSRIVTLASLFFSDTNIGECPECRQFGNQVFDWLAWQWLSADPVAGITEPGEEDQITLTWDARRLQPQTLTGDLLVEHNVPGVPPVEVSTTLSVFPGPSFQADTDSVSFGSVALGTRRSSTVRIHNPGDETLHVSVAGPSSGPFSFTPRSADVSPQGSFEFELSFAPASPGEREAAFSIEHNAAGSPHRVAVHGTGISAPTISIDPPHTVVTVPIGTTQKRTVSLCNDGASSGGSGADPLDFRVRLARTPEGRLDPENASLEPIAGPLLGSGGPDAHGYTWADSDHAKGPVFEWVDIAAIGTAVSLSGDEALTGPIELPFSFPFYDEAFSSLRISSNGWLSFSADDPAHENHPLPSLDAPAHLLAAYWEDLVGADVRYHGNDERFIVQFNNAALSGREVGGSFTFQTTLYPDGRFTYQYLEMLNDDLTAAIGVQNGTRDDGLLVAFHADYVHSGLAVEFWQGPSWVHVSPRAGSVASGDCRELTLEFDTSAIFGGDYQVEVIAESNDPFHPRAVAHVTLRVPGEPSLVLDPTSLDFTKITLGGSETQSIRVENRGVATLHVSDLQTDNDAFQAGLPFDLPPGESHDLSVTFAPQLRGSNVGELVLVSNDPTHPATRVPLTGTGLDPPILSVSPSEFSADLFTSESREFTVAIANDGEADLNWNALPTFSTPAAARTVGPNDMEGLQILRASYWDWYSPRPFSPMTEDLQSRGANVWTSNGLGSGSLSHWDIVWLDSDLYLSEAAQGVVVEWVLGGGALLLTGESAQIRDAFNRVLGDLDAGISFLETPGQSGTSSRIHPHPATADVDSLELRPRSTLEITGSNAGALFEDKNGAVIGAHADVGTGHVIAISDGSVLASWFDRANNRLLGRRTFEWLQGPVWLSATPSAGRLASGETTSITVRVDATNVVEREHTAQLLISNDGGFIAPQVVDVSLGVTNALVMDADSLWLSVPEAVDVKDTLQITNLGPVDVPYSIASSLTSFVPATIGSGSPLARDFQLTLIGKQILFARGHGESYPPYPLEDILYQLGAQVYSPELVITEAALESIDVLAIYALNAVEWTPEEADAVAAWVRRGGAVVFVLGVDSSVIGLNRIASVLGAGFQFSPEDGEGSSITRIASHFITEGVTHLNQGKAPCQIVDIAPPARILLKDPESNVCSVYAEIGAGRVVAFSSEVITDSYWLAPDNELMAGRTFAWLAAPEWVVAEPRSGSVPAGEVANVVLHFASPGMRQGIYQGLVWAHMDGLVQPIDSVAVHLTIGNPSIAVNPTVLDFGDIYTDHDTTLAFAIANEGSLPLTIREISAEEDAFSLDAITMTLAPGEVDSVRVAFRPTVAGEVSASVQLISNDPSDPVAVVELVANALQSKPEILVAPASVDFGEVRVSTTVIDSFRIDNLGQAPLTMSIVGVAEPDFTVTPTFLSMGEGGFGWVRLTFHPAGSGPMSETLSFLSNDPDSPTVEIPLAALVVDPPVIQISPEEITAALISGETTVDGFAIHNLGVESLDWEARIANRQHASRGVGLARGASAPRDAAPFGSTLQDLSGIHILFDRENGEPSSSLWSQTISDLTLRGATVSENSLVIDASVLSSADVFWVTDGNGWSTGETRALAEWLRDGGAVLIEGDQATAVFSRLLDAMDASFRYIPDNGATGISGFINPHWITAGVDSIATASAAQLVVAADTYVLMEDILHQPMAAAERIASGRLVALAEQLGSDLLVGNADNRLFANRIFDWLAEPLAVSLQTTSGSVAGSGFENVAVTIGTGGLASGLHSVDIVIASDDPETPEVVVPVRVEVTGAPAIHVSPSAIDFGVVFSTGMEQASLGVFNPGTDTLWVSAITPSSPVFTVGSSEFAVPPSSSVLVDAIFSPDTPGVHQGELLISSSDPVTPEFAVPVSGTSQLPPVIDVAPATFSVALAESSVHHDSFLVTNSGASELEWSVSFEDDDSTASPADLQGVQVLWDKGHGQGGLVGRSILITNLGWRGATVTASRDALTLEHLQSFDVLWTEQVTVAWSAAERTAVVDWVNNGGHLLLEGSTDLTVQVFNETLSALESGIAFTREDASAGLLSNPSSHWITRDFFPVTLIESGAFLSEVTGPAIRLFDDAAGRPIAAAAEVGEGRVFACLADRIFRNDRLGSPGLGSKVFRWFHSWTVVHPVRGVVAPGTSQPVAASWQSIGRVAGALSGRLLFENNDPVSSLVTVPLSVEIVGVPVIATHPDSVILEDVFVGRSRSSVVLFSNVGSAPLVVSSIDLDVPDYVVEPSSFSLEPGLGQDVMITLSPTTVGDRTATMMILHNAEGSPTLLPILADARIEPEIQRSPATLEVSLDVEGTTTRTLSICNLTPDDPPGQAAPLRFEIQANDAPGELRAVGGLDDFGHYWIDSDSPGGPVFDWIDIREVGTPLDLVGDDQNRGPFPVGFDFPFFGDVVSEFRACTNGWVSFSSLQGTGNNLELPCACANSPPGLLAMWWDDLQLATGSPGWYHSDGSRLVIQYQDAFRSSPAGGPYTFEAILYADGRILLQYLTMGAELTSGTIGIQNEARDDGMTVVHNSAYLHDGLAIEIRKGPGWILPSPRSGLVAGGECLDVDLTFRGALADAVNPSAELVIRSNDPDAPQVTTSVVLNILGADALREGALTLPVHFALHANSPNPFGGATDIRFDLPRETLIRIRLFDVSGRLIRNLVDQDLPAGRHSVTWDGSDSSGRRTAAGVYFYRMDGGSFSETRKMVRLK